MAHHTASDADEQLDLAVPVDLLEFPQLVVIQLILVSFLQVQQTVGEEHEFVVDGRWHGIFAAVAQVIPANTLE